MEEVKGRSIDGFCFLNREDCNIAKEEIQRINYISSKLNEDNPEAILSVYNKMIESRTFLTPIGLEYLRQIQNYLYKSTEISDDRVTDIPVVVSYSDIDEKIEKKESDDIGRTIKRNKPKNFKNEYKTSLIVNLVLVLMIVAMFILALKTDSPNMINYENAIVDKYAQWNDELTERESKIREKEAELGLE